MKKMVFTLFFVILFIGCGSSSGTPEDNNGSLNTPSSVNEEVSTVVDLNNSESNITEEEPAVELTGFAKMQDLIKKSRDGILNDVTYICVGDSTRAKSKEDQANLMFERVKATLDNYKVNSILLARGSQELAHFLEIKLENDKVRKPTYKDVIAATPGTGSHTIIDFALGINDLWDLHVRSKTDMVDAEAIIKERVLRSIELIKEEKPDVNFFLTSPNPLLDWEEGSEVYATVYRDVASELNLPFVNYVDNVMPSRVQDENSTSISFEEWYRLEPTSSDSNNRDPIHFSKYGLDKVADYILEHILPKD